MLAGFVAYQQLPVSALPEVDYPIIQVLTFYPGASPDVMASSVTAPLERQFGADARPEADDLHQLRGGSVITLEFNLDEDIDVAEQEVQAAINAAQQLPAHRPAQPADLQQGEPGRRADPDAGAHLRHHAAATRSKTWPTPTWRRRSPRSPASAWSPSPAARSRPCASRPIRRSSPPTASALKICARPSPPPTSIRPRATLNGTAPVLHHRRQRSAADLQRRLQARHHRLSQRRAGPHVRRGDVVDGCGEHHAGRVDEPQPGRHRQHPAPARRQHHRRGRPHQSPAAAVARPACRRRSRFTILTDRTTTIRASVNDVEFELMLTIGAGRDGDLPLPAQPCRHHHSQRRRAALAWSAPSA